MDDNCRELVVHPVVFLVIVFVAIFVIAAIYHALDLVIKKLVSHI